MLTSNPYFFERKILKQMNLVNYSMTIDEMGGAPHVEGSSVQMKGDLLSISFRRH